MNITFIAIISISVLIIAEFLTYAYKKYKVKYNIDKIIIFSIKFIAVILPIVAYNDANTKYNEIYEANEFKKELLIVSDSLITVQDNLIDELCNHDWNEHQCDIPVLGGYTTYQVDKYVHLLDSLYLTQQ